MAETTFALASLLKQKPFDQMNNIEINLLDLGPIYETNDGAISTNHGYIDSETNGDISIDNDLYYFRKIRKSLYKFGLHSSLGMILYTGNVQDFIPDNAIQLTITGGPGSDYIHFADMCEYDGLIYGVSYNTNSIVEVVINPTSATISFTEMMLVDLGVSDCTDMIACLYNIFGGTGSLHIAMCISEYNPNGPEYVRLYSKPFDGSYLESYNITSDTQSYSDKVFAMFENNPILICKGSTYIEPNVYGISAFSFSFEESFYATKLWSIQTGWDILLTQFNGDAGYYWNGTPT